MIKSFKNTETENIFNGVRSKKFPNEIQKRAFIKLQSLQLSHDVNDLRNPPANHLEQLKGDRAGQYSIKINDKYRICFRWLDNSAFDVEIVDYH